MDATAHDHARAASIATHSSETTVAINEHALAAGEFSKAASGTGNVEALRTLRLLEQHHQRLSELLRYPTEHPPATASDAAEVQATTEKPLSTSAAVAELRASKSDLGPRTASPLRTPPSLAHNRRLPPRELSSSIASNLASARGIRANYTRQPLSPSISTQQAPGNLESLPRKDSKISKIPASIPEHGQPSWVPPTQPKKSEAQTSTSRTPMASQPSIAAGNEEGFSRFYSTFENILHRLSAPLAFAGLPLVSEDGPKSPEPDVVSPKRTKLPRERTGSDPDLTKFISRAALRASARDGHAGTDSFYVVPATGHTVSYAHILSFAEKEKRRMEATMHSENPDLFTDPNEEDDFVDARETPMPTSPSSSKTTKGRKPNSKELENRVEELSTENQSLKVVVDRLSKRLHAFEMSAQNSSMALQESMRMMRDMSPVGRAAPALSRGNSAAGGADEGLRRRITELEEHIRLGGKQMAQLEKENAGLNSKLGQYREKWAKLKESAKNRRGGDFKNGSSAQASPQPDADRDVPP
ncbi:hypothetical protein B0O99DRAFT_680743 [Bisporella sp. PMI_857]|nr:hypothetical protein B0O99DRAFT_680743 [Bisporella sp. PMI_857]